jgi:hypothetical protein
MGKHFYDPLPNGDCPVLYSFGSVSLLSGFVSDLFRKAPIKKHMTPRFNGIKTYTTVITAIPW